MPPRTRSTRSSASQKKLKQQTLLSHLSSPSASSEKKGDKSKPRITGKPGKSSQGKPIQVSESDAESPVHPRGKNKQCASRSPEEDGDSSDVGRIQFEARTSPPQSSVTRGSTSEVDVGPFSPSRTTKRQRILNSESENSENESDKPPVRTSRRLVRRDGDIEENSASDVPKAKKSRLVKGERPVLSDEDNDILSGIDEEKIIDTRLRGPKPSQRSKFMENLEKLKRKKLGVTLSESEEEEPSDDAADLLPGARQDTGDNQHEESDSEVAEQSHDNEPEEALDDFIVEDEGEIQGVTLPAVFSMNTHQDLVHHFKVVCQYLVHLAVTTTTARARIADRLSSDEYFSVPLSITRRKVGDIRDSIASSVWRPAYRKALLTYPEFELYNLDFAIPHCDACHLGGRLSTVVGRLGGNPYDRKTFEPRSTDLDSLSEDSDNENERNPPEFNLGRFCARRTSVYHELCHWEYELFRSLSREVEELSNAGRGFVRIAYTGGVEPPEDVSDADQIMEWLDQRGIINAEWLKVKQLMSSATNLEADVKRGREDD